MRSCYVLLLLIICSSACNGQGNPLQIQGTTTKLIKKQGSNEYASVNSILQAKNGELWFGTSAEGVYRYNGVSFTNYTTKDGLCSNTTTGLLQDKDGNIWIGTDVGICRYDGRNFVRMPVSTSGYISLANQAAPSPKTKVACMMLDKTGKVWVATEEQLYRYDGNKFTRFLDDSTIINKNKLILNSVKSMLQDKDGNIWFSTWFEGLCRYDGKELVNFKPNKEVWYAGLYEDREGRIWIGRRTKGVVYYDGKTFNNLSQGGAFDECGVTGIMQDKQGNMWFGTEAGEMTMRETIGGVWRYDGKAFKNYIPDGGKGNYCVFTLLQDKAGNIWAGTRGTGLYQFDGNKFVAFSE